MEFLKAKNIIEILPINMTFNDFEALALNPQYLHDKVVYRVDLHYIMETGKNELEFAVSKRHSFLYPDLKTVEFMMKRFVGKEMFKKDLFAIYVYELPFNKDVLIISPAGA